MKKAMAMVILAMVIFLAIPAYADYKEAVREDVRKELGAFFKRNEGSKLTIDLVDGLAIHMGQIFEQNKIKEEVPKIDKPVSPVKKEVQK
jgi:thiamine monophosphate kinase